MRDEITHSSEILSRLSRVRSPGRQFIPQIDGLRFIAILAVIAYHIAAVYMFHRKPSGGVADPPQFWLNTIFAAGHNGVALFFTISGFILSLPFAREALRDGPRVTLQEYYWRRVTRIEPPYIIQLLVMFAFCVLVFRKLPSHPQLYQNSDWLSYVAAHLTTSLFYAHSAIFGQHAYPNYVLWSLEVEVQFYILAPFLARMLFLRERTLRRMVLTLLIAAGVGLSLNFGHHYRFWASILGNLHFFLLGFLFADLFIEGELSLAVRHYRWDFAAFGAAILVVLGEDRIDIIILPLAIAVCFLAAFRGVITAQLLQNRWVTTLGGMCYTIYMYHAVCISMLIRGTEKLRFSNPSLDLFFQFVLITLAIIPVCGVLFVLTERPFMDRNWPTKLRRAFRKKASPEKTELLVR